MQILTKIFTVAITTFALETSSYGLTTNWINAAGGNWNVATNWSQGVVPSPGDSVNITLAGTYAVDLDTLASCYRLAIGGLTGTQTLLVNNALTIGGGASAACRIDTHGVLDVLTVVSATGASTVLTNYGTVYIRAGDSVVVGSNVTNGYGSHLWLYAGARLAGSSTQTLSNSGTVEIAGTSAEILMSISNSSSGSVMHVDGGVSTYNITNNGLVNLAPDASLYLNLAGLVPSTLTNAITTSTIRLRGGSLIDGGIAAGAWPRVMNGGRVEVVSDTGLTSTLARIATNYTTMVGPGSGKTITVSYGNLQLDSSTIFDSVYVAASCTLKVQRSTFQYVSNANPYDDARVFGSGTIHCFGGDLNTIWGTWTLFAGGLVAANSAEPMFVGFRPVGGPVHMRSLRLDETATFFVQPGAAPIFVDTLYQSGGTAVGLFHVAFTYQWTSGTFQADSALIIGPGGVLDVSTGGAKTLDSTDIVIEGSATMQDSGVFTLVDSAVVNVAPGGTLTFGPGFPMTGVGEFYNSGQATFDPQGDTIRIDVPVTNSTIARTPGTIDVLSTPVVFGAGGSNGASIFIHGGGLLTLHGLFVNDGGALQVMNGGELSIRDTLFNARNSILEFKGGSSISGAGRIINKGQLIKSGAVLLTTTNVLVEPVLQNDVDTGYVNVTVDTLTLLSGGVNRGIITILPGAVLKILGVFLNDTTGVIQGGGVLDVSEATFANAGTISPGMSPGSLIVNGSVVCSSSSVLRLELCGPGSADYDHLVVSGDVQFGGTLALSILEGYIPQPSDNLQILNCASWTGQFSSITGTALSNGEFLDVNFGPGGMVITPLAGLNIVARVADPAAHTLRIAWREVSGALLYTVYADSDVMGSFLPVQTVMPPDTFVVLSTDSSPNRRYYYVTATLP